MPIRPYEGRSQARAFHPYNLSAPAPNPRVKVNSLFFYNVNVFASIPEPVSYDTDRLTVRTDYTTRPVQASFSYIFSSFTNDQASFRAVTPFTAATIPGYQASELSLPPSNQEHRVKAQFGVSPLVSTHIAMNLSYALQLQNEAYTARLYERTPKITDANYDGLIKTLYGRRRRQQRVFGRHAHGDRPRRLVNRM